MKDRNLDDIRFITPNGFPYGSTDGTNPNLEVLRGLLEGINRIVKPGGRVFLGTLSPCQYYIR